MSDFLLLGGVTNAINMPSLSRRGSAAPQALHGARREARPAARPGARRAGALGLDRGRGRGGAAQPEADHRRRAGRADGHLQPDGEHGERARPGEGARARRARSPPRARGRLPHAGPVTVGTPRASAASPAPCSAIARRAWSTSSASRSRPTSPATCSTSIGAQWGDEGKGKIVDWLASRADVVVRFQGGHNAGHTLVVGEQVYKLSLLPSGIVRGKLSVIGNGVVLDPWALKDEVEKLRAQGVRSRPKPADRRHLPADPADPPRPRRAARGCVGRGKIGTTRRGIGPAYEDKVGRRAIRVCDLAHLDELGPQLDRLLRPPRRAARRLRRAAGRPRALLRDLARSPTSCCPSPAGLGARRGAARGRRILFEGAQGVLLDVDHGTYPFVTSSNTVAGTAAAAPAWARARPASCSASSRPTPPASAPAPFPTELDDESASGSASAGASSAPSPAASAAAAGSTRCWCASRCAVSGVTGIALTKLDVLDGFETRSASAPATGSTGALRLSPAHAADQARVEPIYEEMRAGARAPPARAAGPTCRRRRSNISAASRS
jgi:adenylosuccinate synthase